MPYLILIAGILLGLFGLYRFVVHATPAQIRALLISAIVLATALAVFFLAVTGRLPAAMGLVAALAPFILMWLKQKYNAETAAPQTGNEPADGPMTRKEALEILNLEENAGPEEIEAAYKRLIKKVHPDQEGSVWMAAKLNQARDILLG